MFDNEGHWIDDPLDVVNAKPDFSGLGLVRHLTDEQNYHELSLITIILPQNYD